MVYNKMTDTKEKMWCLEIAGIAFLIFLWIMFAISIGSRIFWWGNERSQGMDDNREGMYDNFRP